MPASRIEGDYHFNGTLTAKSIVLADASIGNAKIAAAAAIDASKVLHQFSIDHELIPPGIAITALTKLLKIVRGATGTILAAQAIITTQATGADRTVTIDIQKSTGGGAFSTICTTQIQISSSTTPRTIVAATLNNTSLVAGDILQAVVSVAGSQGNQAQGLLLTLTTIEAPA